MTDRLAPPRRSAYMAAIRGRHTGPEPTAAGAVEHGLGSYCLLCGNTFNALRSDCSGAEANGTVQVSGRAGDVEVLAL